MKMPASFAEFSDALQKARIKDGSFCKNELTCIHYNGLTHAMIGWNANLYDLNLFAQRLASLTEEQKKGMDALLKIKQNHRVAPIPLNQLINLTYNTDICCFAPRVSNHEELGAFLYANEMLSNEAMALLDTTEEGSGFQERLLELLGEQHQEDHGGVFTDFGYAELGGEIKDIYVCQSNETACFHRSDAPVMLEVRKGFFNDPSYDNDKTAVLNLPAADAGIWRAVEKVDAASVDECAFRCVDCLIPFLRDAINNAIDDEDGIEQADEFAKRLAQIEREWPESDMVKYKALLSVVDHPSLQDATRLMGEIDQYELRPEVAQTWGYRTARGGPDQVFYGQPDPPKPVSGDPHCGRRERRPAQEPGGLLRGRVGHLPAHSVAGTDVFRLPVQRTHAGAYRPEHYGTAAEKLWKRGL